MGVFTGLLAHVATNSYLFDSLNLVVLGSFDGHANSGPTVPVADRTGQVP
jgi:hypothetical protein